MDEFLGFIDEIGRTRDGGYIYRFDFTLDTETIWGEYFNVTPSAIIPDLQADINAQYSASTSYLPLSFSTQKPFLKDSNVIVINLHIFSGV